MHTLIHHDQTAYVKNRFTGESIRLTDDILEYADDNDIPSILFPADFEKAFDSIDYSFMFAVLEKGDGNLSKIPPKSLVLLEF